MLGIKEWLCGLRGRVQAAVLLLIILLCFHVQDDKAQARTGLARFLPKRTNVVATSDEVGRP